MSDPKQKRKGRVRERSPDTGLQHQLQAILTRLNALEGNSFQDILATTTQGAVVGAPAPVRAPPAPSPPEPSLQPLSVEPPPSLPSCSVPPSPAAPEASGRDCVVEVTNKIANAINAIAQVRSNNIYISNFDPSLHDFQVWCDEVDHVRALNR